MSVMRMPTLPPAEARLMRWLALAVLLHAGLLLVPTHDGARPANPMTPLRIALTATGTATVGRMSAADPQPAAVAEQETAVADTLPEMQAQSVAAEHPASDSSPQPDAPSLSAARLFDLDGRREWRLDPFAGPQRLGVFTPRALPENWRSGIPYRNDRSGGRTPPGRVEIVDRWLAADGSHNVLVETPSGERLCGRAEAWNPTQPLVEPVMMFRSCGAAPPTFALPGHYGGKNRP